MTDMVITATAVMAEVDITAPMTPAGAVAGEAVGDVATVSAPIMDAVTAVADQGAGRQADADREVMGPVGAGRAPLADADLVREVTAAPAVGPVEVMEAVAMVVATKHLRS